MGLLLLAQAAALAGQVQLDIAKLVMGLIVTVLSMLIGVVGFLLRRLLTGFDGFKSEVRANLQTVSDDLGEHSAHVDARLGVIQGELQKVTQEMFGPNGDNGMRGDLRKTKDLVVRHDRLLVRLADRADLPFNTEE